MREYKFRGKRIDNWEWVYGYLLETQMSGVYIIGTKTKSKLHKIGGDVTGASVGDVVWQHAVDPDTVGQYTGLKDKNNKEIYEGDILRLWRSVGKKGQLRGEYAYLLPVEYCELWTQFVVVDKPNKIQMGIWKEFGAFEVIGNIYDNPELMKEGSV